MGRLVVSHFRQNPVGSGGGGGGGGNVSSDGCGVSVPILAFIIGDYAKNPDNR